MASQGDKTIGPFRREEAGSKKVCYVRAPVVGLMGM
jgi:hypothetical protein